MEVGGRQHTSCMSEHASGPIHEQKKSLQRPLAGLLERALLLGPCWSSVWAPKLPWTGFKEKPKMKLPLRPDLGAKLGLKKSSWAPALIWVMGLERKRNKEQNKKK